MTNPAPEQLADYTKANPLRSARRAHNARFCGMCRERSGEGSGERRRDAWTTPALASPKEALRVTPRPPPPEGKPASCARAPITDAGTHVPADALGCALDRLIQAFDAVTHVRGGRQAAPRPEEAQPVEIAQCGAVPAPVLGAQRGDGGGLNGIRCGPDAYLVGTQPRDQIALVGIVGFHRLQAHKEGVGGRRHHLFHTASTSSNSAR